MQVSSKDVIRSAKSAETHQIETTTGWKFLGEIDRHIDGFLGDRKIV